MREARQRYFQENGLPEDGGEAARWVRVQFGPLLLLFPNSKSRVRSLIRHDLHHIANDCDTSLIGEGLVAAWELGKGCGNHPVAWFLQLQALWWGILFAPRRAFAAYLKGRQSRNLYHEEDAHKWLSRSVQQLRVYLFPGEFILQARFGDVFRYVAFAIIGLVLFLIALPFYLFPVTIVLLAYQLVK